MGTARVAGDDGGTTSEPVPPATDPAATDPAVTDPAATHPAATDPAATHPAATGFSATDPAATGPASTSRSPAGRVRRAWAAPVWVHLAALALILVALMAVVGTGASFSADEGAAITQAKSLARGDGWIVAHPLPQADPEGANYPLELSAKGPRGVSPFAKHPLYAIVLAGAERAGGVTAMVALSMLGTLAAAA
ncbi:MAG: hypothetical protein QOI99_877, partial [Actinomycetota bacterium]|nr:hypothetical protein [Actinomycetota bacterium]